MVKAGPARVAVVTGASRGIGKGVALALGRAGHDVVVNFERSAKEAEKVAAAIGGMGRKAIAVKADVASERDVLAMRDRVMDEFGKVDILVNNAGIHQHLKFWDLSRKDWDRVIAVNLTGPFLCAKAFVNGMRERRWGRIVNISSVIGLMGTDHEIHYAASKGGLFSLTKSMARELAPYDVTVNAVSPGWIDTDMTKGISEEEARVSLAQVPMKRVGAAEDIAGAVVFLCGDEAAYMTGATIHVNGGWGMW
jgi:3-oxoacyl-[acyl-carrier protein] reductase